MKKLCRLDCLQTDYLKRPLEKRVVEFEGPVKIVIVDSHQSAFNKRLSVCVNMGYFLMGAIMMPIFFYVFTNKMWPLQNAHVLFCSMGYFMYVPSAFLGSSRWNGATTVLKVEDRKQSYICNKILGFLSIAAGTIVATVKDFRNIRSSFNTNYTLHSLTGISAGALAILDVFTMPFAMFSRGRAERCTEIFGIPSFLMGVASYGIILWESRKFSGKMFRIYPCLYVYLVAVGYYALIVIMSPVVSFLTCG